MVESVVEGVLGCGRGCIACADIYVKTYHSTLSPSAINQRRGVPGFPYI